MSRRAVLALARLAAAETALGGCRDSTVGRTAQYILPRLLGSQASASYSTVSPELKGNLHKLSPLSLAYDRPVETPIETTALRRALLRIAGFYSKESQQIRGAKALYEGVVEQGTNKQLFQDLGLEQRFATQYYMMCLHIWLILVRLRAEGPDGKDLAQVLYEDFTEDTEIRVRAEGVKVRIGKWLAELEQMFYGSCMAYDKAIKDGPDAALTAALHRNIFGAEDGKLENAGVLARYVRRELACLAMTPSELVMAGKIKFSTEFLPGGKVDRRVGSERTGAAEGAADESADALPLGVELKAA